MGPRARILRSQDNRADRRRGRRRYGEGPCWTDAVPSASLLFRFATGHSAGRCDRQILPGNKEKVAHFAGFFDRLSAAVKCLPASSDKSSGSRALAVREGSPDGGANMGQTQQDDIDALLAGVSQLAADAAADIVGDDGTGPISSGPATAVANAPAAEDDGKRVPKRTQMPSGMPIVAPASSERSEDPQRILPLEVPVIVTLAERTMPLSKILALTPGSIIEFDKPSDELLDLMINNRRIGRGQAVKVGENFGLRVTMIGSIGNRVEAMNAV